jgi:hypothetical protein
MKPILHSQPASTPNLLLARTIVGLALTTLAGYAQSNYEPYTFTTIAGKAGSMGSKDGTNSGALFNYPYELVIDRTGGIYVSDGFNNTIRKMTPVGTNWVVTTIAGKAGSVGSADGTNSNARFNGPTGLAMDSVGNLFVSDFYNHTLRKMTPTGTNWVVTTIAGKAGLVGGADGMNSDARFNGASNVAMDKHGNLYMGDDLDKTIRKITPVGTNWVVTTIAGKSGISGSADGTNSAARFTWPSGVVVDSHGNLYVAEEVGFTIRKITPMGTNWVVTTIAGKAGVPGFKDGIGTSARLNGPVKLVMDSSGNLFVSDDFNNTIRKLAPVGTNWVVTTLAGKPGFAGGADGTGSNARQL